MGWLQFVKTLSFPSSLYTGWLWRIYIHSGGPTNRKLNWGLDLDPTQKIIPGLSFAYICVVSHHITHLPPISLSINFAILHIFVAFLPWIFHFHHPLSTIYWILCPLQFLVSWFSNEQRSLKNPFAYLYYPLYMFLILPSLMPRVPRSSANPSDLIIASTYWIGPFKSH